MANTPNYSEEMSRSISILARAVEKGMFDDFIKDTPKVKTRTADYGIDKIE